MATGLLGWPPHFAWSATIVELYMALEGYRRANSPAEVKPMTRAEAEDLADKYGGPSYSIKRKIKASGQA